MLPAMSTDVKRWLEELGLDQYAAGFEAGAIDWDVLPSLDHEILKELGVGPPGHRLRILKAVQDLGNESTNEVSPSPTNPNPSPGEAERRQLTVMFCDLVGSTELSQRLDPEDLREINRAYQDACKVAIERYDGYVARYMGDGVLAYFGYPQAHEDDAERAIHAGLGVTDEVKALNESVGESHNVDLGVRVGIATGPVVVGDLIGDGASQESAVVGETPNLAARLQSVAEPNRVFISDTTHRVAGAAFDYLELGARELIGFPTPQRIWCVTSSDRASSRFETTRRAQLTPMVGREEELAIVSRRWARTCEGEGQVVLLSGEPGIGKSRLAETFLQCAIPSGAILRFQCSPYHTNSALYPIAQELNRTANIQREDSQENRLAKLEQLLAEHFDDTDAVVPLFATLLSITVGDRFEPVDLSPEELKRRLFDTLVVYFTKLAQCTPIAMLFEDLHWIDPSSKELLERLVAEGQSLSLLLVLTFRPDFSAPWIGQAHVSLLALSRLARRECLEIIEGLGGVSLSQDLIEQVVSKTDGVPLFLEELTETVLASDINDNGGGRASPNEKIPLSVPETLHESLMARLDHLAANSRKLAQNAAAIGREFTGKLLAAISSNDSREIVEALSTLTASGLIIGKGADTYAFKHALVQEAAYESLLKSRRRELHGRIANSLIRDFADVTKSEPELVAHHLAEACLADDAVQYWCRAGKRAAERCAFLEAQANFNRGLEQLPGIDDERQRARREIETRVALAAPLRGLEGALSKSAADNSKRALELCEEFGETEHLFPALWGRWQVLQNYRVRDARSVANRLVELSQQLDDTGLELESHHCQWSSCLVLGKLDEVLEHTRIGMKMYEPASHHALTHTYGGHDPGVCAHAVNGIAVWLAGYPVESQAQLQSALKLSRELGHRFTEAMALGAGVYMAAAQRDIDLVAARVGDFEVFVGGDYSDWQALGRAANALVAYARDGRDGKSETLRSTTSACLEGPMIMAAPIAAAAAGELGSRGEMDYGLELVEQALQRTELEDSRWFEAKLHRVKGVLLYQQGADGNDRAQQCLEQAVTIARAQGAKLWELRAEVSRARICRDQGKRQVARALVAPIYDRFTEGFDTPDLKEAEALLGQLA